MERRISCFAGDTASIDEQEDYGDDEAIKKPSVFPSTPQAVLAFSHVSLRGVLSSALLGSLFCVIIHRLSLTTGIVPHLNVSAGLLAFFFVKISTFLLDRIGIQQRPFTVQENTTMQTCIVACYGVAFSGGFSTYLLAMDQTTYDIVNSADHGQVDSSADVKNPGLAWMIAYLLSVSFLGLVAILPLRKIMIVDYKLSFPSGTATAMLINSFHTPHGSKQAQKQILCLGKYFSISFLFSMFKWSFSGLSGSCGFDHFPTLGFKAYEYKIYFDFNMTYVGAGMICPHLVNFSMLLGGVLSWTLLWPRISSHAGDWYPLELTETDLRGLYGYKVFIAIALILGDGLYNFVKISVQSTQALCLQRRSYHILSSSNDHKLNDDIKVEDKLRNDIFLKDEVSFKSSVFCYVILAVICIITIPTIFHQMRWYYILISLCIAPIFAFCNSYGSGMTDVSLISSYGKLSLFIFSTWAGRNGGVIVGLVSCGIMMVIVSSAADLMQDFKTGYITLSSPNSMYLSQVIGTSIGCIVAPLTFWVFWKAFPVGKETGEYPAPYAVIFREMALLGTKGISTLPKYCLELSLLFFGLSIVTNAFRDMMPSKISKFIPLPMAMALPFYVGPYFAVDMCVGSLLVFAWQVKRRRKADIYSPAVASGLMCGDGMWTLISAFLALANVRPQMCLQVIRS